jgi:hypothetical protein
VFTFIAIKITPTRYAKAGRDADHGGRRKATLFIFRRSPKLNESLHRYAGKFMEGVGQVVGLLGFAVVR